MDIELVIKIPKESYDHILKAKSVPDVLGIDIVTTINAVKNSTPLPKGHGKLMILSEDAIKREQESLSFSSQYWISEVGLSNATVAIIEADKGDKE